MTFEESVREVLKAVQINGEQLEEYLQTPQFINAIKDFGGYRDTPAYENIMRYIASKEYITKMLAAGNNDMKIGLLAQQVARDGGYRDELVKDVFSILKWAFSYYELAEFRYNACETIADHQKFINDYPNSAFTQKAQASIIRIKIAACVTLNEIIAPYTNKKEEGINADKCSEKAFDLAKKKKDFKLIISIFRYSKGYYKAKHKLEEIAQRPKRIRKKYEI